MNKQFLLPVLATLCASLANNVVAEEKFKTLNLDESTAEYLINHTLRCKLRAYNAQRYAENVEKIHCTAKTISYARNRALEAKHEADQIEQELITFGHQAEAAKQTEDPKNDLAGRTTALELLKQLRKKLVDEVEIRLVSVSADIQNNRKLAIEHSEKALSLYEKLNEDDANYHRTDANFHNRDAQRLENEHAHEQNMLMTLTKDIDDVINNLGDTQPLVENSFTQYIKTIAANKWAKKAAGIIVTCTIGKFLYNRYNRSKKSNDEENDHE